MLSYPQANLCAEFCLQIVISLHIYTRIFDYIGIRVRQKLPHSNS